MVVAKFKALFRYWCERTEEYHYKVWSRDRNLKLKQAALKTLTKCDWTWRDFNTVSAVG